MNWGQRLLRRREMDAKLEKELRFHLELHEADLIASGMSTGEARRQARLALGGPEQVAENCRDARGTRWLEDMLRDFRYAIRALWQRPGFAVVTLLTLALGVGATTVMFTLINGVLLKPLPYRDAARLVVLQEKTEKATQFGNLWAFSYPNYLDCHQQARTLQLAVWRYSGGTVSAPGNAEYVDGREISSDLLPMLGVALLHGRAFLPEEDRPGAAPVAIISQGLWERLYGENANALGRPLVFEGKAYTVVGVVPADFRLEGAADVFTPLGQNAGQFMQKRDNHPGLRVWGRLRPNVAAEAAQTELGVIAGRLAAQYPSSNTGRGFILQPLRPNVGDVQSTLWLLLGAVSLVLLIACVNVASLLLARAVSRDREVAMRIALGASRGRLMRQCLTESAVLGLSGGILGILLAALGLRPFITFWPGSLPRAEEVHLDWRVLVFALGVSLLCGILFGLAPALRVPVRGLEQSLRAGSRTVAGSSRRLHGGFVAAEIALAVVLLISAGMLGRTLLRLSSLDPGVRIQNVLVSRMALSPGALSTPGQIRAAWRDALDRASHVPGVQSVAIVDTVPLREGYNQLGYSTTPALPPRDEMPISLATCVTPDYLKVMGIALRQGRFFNDRDRLGSAPVVVIDEVMAQRAFGRTDVAGMHLWLPDIGPGMFEIVGVVGHVRYWGLAGDDDAQVREQFYYPFGQLPERFLRRWSELMSIAVRTDLPPRNLIEPLRRAVRGANGDQVLYEVQTMEQLASDSLARQRFLLLLFSAFAGLALVLASVGIYGVLAYLTGQRVPELGVRMAFGASARHVLWLVLRQSLGMILVGVSAGLCAALAAARLLEHLVEGMRPAGPLTFSIMISVLVLAALAASFLPARRASRVDPMQALRQD